MASATPLGKTNPRVLIVEDDPIIASCIKEYLESSGYEVVGIAASASAALALAEFHLPGVALVDVELTGPMDGIELACLLRLRYSVPSLFLSGLESHETMNRASAAQPLGFLVKPFRPSRVFNAIEEAVNLHQI